MPKPSLHILPDLHDAEHDREEYHDTHFDLFGHEGPDDPNEVCQHPIHDQIRRQMNGATFEIPFDASLIISADSEVEQARLTRRGTIQEAVKQLQREMDEEKQRKRVSDLGIRIVRH